jgi:peroxiredoxin
MSKHLRPGTRIPDFRLRDERGVPHSLSELQGDDLLVLLLGRGEHCPRERQHQREMVRFHGWCSVAFTQLVTVLPNGLHDVDKLKLSTGAHWTFLADEDLEVQRHFGIDEYTDGHHDATVPHTVLLSPGLKVEKVHVGYWFWGRPSPEQLWLELQEVTKRVKDDYDPTHPAVRARWAAERAQRAA